MFIAALGDRTGGVPIGRTTWVAGVLIGAGVISFGAAAYLDPMVAMAVAFLLGFAYQTTKICADVVVQADTDDAHIGRVYALYDATNNVLYVLAFVVGAMLLTEGNTGRTAIIMLGAIYLLTAAGWRWGMLRYAHHPTAVIGDSAHPLAAGRSGPH